MAIALGTILNPLNSSMVAVALVAIHQDFHVSIGTSTWLISAFYLTGAVGQPLMGRLADLVGPRRVFLSGLGVAAVVSAVAPFAPSFGSLVAIRCVQAFATSTAFPSGLGLIRAAGGNRVPAQSLAVLSVAASAGAALGPTVGGVLLTLWGWQAIFLVNLPLTLIGLGLGLGLRWLPAAPPSDTSASGLGDLDLVGVVLFAATLVPLLAALIEIGTLQGWILLALVPVAALLLAIRELRHRTPFFDLRLLARSPAMVAVFLQFAAVTFVFYSFFFALPVWLEQVGGHDARTAGLVVLPLTGVSVLVTPMASMLINRRGPRAALVFGSVFLLAGSLLMLGVGPATAVLVVAAATVVMGVPSGFNTLGLQAALYEATPRERISWAGGQFQTFRYVGATVASAVLASVFRNGATTSGLHAIAVALALVSAALILASLVTRRATAAPV